MQTELAETANILGSSLKAKRLKVATAESCTGGLIAMALCSVTDSGDFISAGLVTYTNETKQQILNVQKETLDTYTAVSKEVVEQMVAGAIAISDADIALSISGYAGPEGGADGTVAGTIWFGWWLPGGEVVTQKKFFEGTPEEILNKAAIFSLRRLHEQLQ